MRRATFYSSLILCLLMTACSQEAKQIPSVIEPDAAPAPAVSNVEQAQPQSSGIDNRGSEAEDAKWWHALPRPDWANYPQVKTNQGWFEVYEIQKGIYAIYEPGQFEEVISWLILGRKQALLFDTGLGMGDIKSVVKQVTKLPLMVLNSHGHYDHIGGNYQFDNLIARNLPYTKQRSKGLPHEQVAEFASPDWIWKPHPPGFNAADYQIQPYQFSGWIDAGQFIDLGGVSLEVLPAPGHAPDGIVLVDHQRRLMFTGDVFYPAPLYAHLEGSSIEDYAATAQRLAAIASEVDYLLPSHNIPIASSDYLIQLDAALKAIINETAQFEVGDGAREYSFDGFSILTHDPPLEAAAEIELL
jgi:glyoxylase-like metal-dependent hydrolase (beta-lactamase superfamily II)